MMFVKHAALCLALASWASSSVGVLGNREERSVQLHKRFRELSQRGGPITRDDVINLMAVDDVYRMEKENDNENSQHNPSVASIPERTQSHTLTQQAQIDPASLQRINNVLNPTSSTLRAEQVEAENENDYENESENENEDPNQTPLAIENQNNFHQSHLQQDLFEMNLALQTGKTTSLDNVSFKPQYLDEAKTLYFQGSTPSQTIIKFTNFPRGTSSITVPANFEMDLDSGSFRRSSTRVVTMNDQEITITSLPYDLKVQYMDLDGCLPQLRDSDTCVAQSGFATIGSSVLRFEHDVHDTQRDSLYLLDSGLVARYKKWKEYTGRETEAVDSGSISFSVQGTSTEQQEYQQQLLNQYDQLRALDSSMGIPDFSSQMIMRLLGVDDYDREQYNLPQLTLATERDTHPPIDLSHIPFDTMPATAKIAAMEHINLLMNIRFNIMDRTQQAISMCHSGANIEEILKIWFEAESLYTGLTISNLAQQERDLPIEQGDLLFKVAQVEASQFRTMVQVDEQQDTYVAQTNLNIMEMFAEGPSFLMNNDCELAQKVQDSIEKEMLTTLIQGTIRRTRKLRWSPSSFITDVDKAEAMIFALTVLPLAEQVARESGLNTAPIHTLTHVFDVSHVSSQVADHQSTSETLPQDDTNFVYKNIESIGIDCQALCDCLEAVMPIFKITCDDVTGQPATSSGRCDYSALGQNEFFNDEESIMSYKPLTNVDVQKQVSNDMRDIQSLLDKLSTPIELDAYLKTQEQMLDIYENGKHATVATLSLSKPLPMDVPAGTTVYAMSNEDQEIPTFVVHDAFAQENTLMVSYPTSGNLDCLPTSQIHNNRALTTEVDIDNSQLGCIAKDTEILVAVRNHMHHDTAEHKNEPLLIESVHDSNLYNLHHFSEGVFEAYQMVTNDFDTDWLERAETIPYAKKNVYQQLYEYYQIPDFGDKFFKALIGSPSEQHELFTFVDTDSMSDQVALKFASKSLYWLNVMPVVISELEQAVDSCERRGSTSEIAHDWDKSFAFFAGFEGGEGTLYDELKQIALKFYNTFSQELVTEQEEAPSRASTRGDSTRTQRDTPSRDIVRGEIDSSTVVETVSASETTQDISSSLNVLAVANYEHGLSTIAQTDCANKCLSLKSHTEEIVNAFTSSLLQEMLSLAAISTNQWENHMTEVEKIEAEAMTHVLKALLVPMHQGCTNSDNRQFQAEFEHLLSTESLPHYKLDEAVDLIEHSAESCMHVLMEDVVSVMVDNQKETLDIKI